MMTRDTGNNDLEPKSKTQQKREAQAAQALGKQLVELSESQINELADKLGLPDGLHDALLECRSIKSHEARRRQLQYIGKLMRDIDLEPIQALLARFKQGGAAQAAQLHLIENWRERLLNEGEPAFKELQQTCPEIDVKHMRKLIAAAHREAKQKQPPKSARLLFRYLRDFLPDLA